MPNQYANNLWQQFRAEVIELDGNRCRRCGYASAEGAILHVHHNGYTPRRKPWEYPYSVCETLCQGCHAAEHGIIRPKVGWEYVGTEDLGDLCGECEVCGTEIRHVFFIQHPHWEPLAVGTICCDNLTGTVLASNHMESLARFASRRDRFVGSSRWKDEGNRLFIHQKNIDLGIHGAASGFQICMNGCEGHRVFPTIEQAKIAAFDAIESGKAELYLQKRGYRALPRRIRRAKR